jgi:hypothetical protein
LAQLVLLQLVIAETKEMKASKNALTTHPLFRPLSATPLSFFSSSESLLWHCFVVGASVLSRSHQSNRRIVVR